MLTLSAFSMEISSVKGNMLVVVSEEELVISTKKKEYNVHYICFRVLVSRKGNSLVLINNLLGQHVILN